MSDTVFVLGAGAARPSGAPLMSDFFDRARELRLAGRLGENARDYDSVTDTIYCLGRCAMKSELDLDNLEAVFTALEMVEIIGSIDGIPQEELPQRRDSLQRLIAATIEHSMQFPLAGYRDNRNLAAPKGYAEIAAVVAKACHHDSQKRCSIISFNYDVGLEWALALNRLRYQYGQDGTVDRSQNRVGFYKLHGSLNWLQKSDGTIDVAHFDFNTLDIRSPRHDGVTEVSIPFGSMRTEWAKRTGSSETPVIVPPTDSKLGHRRQLANVWKCAAEELREATRIIVIGFSLPDTDQFFRNFFALSTISNVPLQHFIVVDPFSLAPQRFESLLSARARRRFKWLEGPIETKAAALQRMMEWG